MKSLIVAVLIIFLAAGAVFGLMAMSHEGEHMGNCFASLARGVLCPQFSGLLDLVNFHFNVLAGLSSAIFNQAALILNIFAVLLFIGLFYIVRPDGCCAYRLSKSKINNSSQYQSRLIQWLSLFEKRDPLFI